MAVSVFAVTGCQPKGLKSADGLSSGGGSASITIVPSTANATTSPTAAKQQPLSFESYTQSSIPVANSYVLPTSLDQFNCFAVNVMGPGISNNQACGGTTQMGIAAGFVNGADGSVSVDVPFGPQRTIQLWGFAGSTSCPDVTTLLNLAQGGFPPGVNSAGFLLGEATTDIYASTMVINMSLGYIYGQSPMVCGRLPAPSTTIDYVKYDMLATSPSGGSIAGQSVPPTISANNDGVCVGFHTSAANPAFSCTLTNISNEVLASSEVTQPVTSSSTSSIPCTLPFDDSLCTGAAYPTTNNGQTEYILHIPKSTLPFPGGLNFPNGEVTNTSLTIETTDKSYGQVDGSPPSFAWSVDLEGLTLSYGLPTSLVNITGALTNGSNCIASPSTLVGIYTGQTVTDTTAGHSADLPAGVYVAGLPGTCPSGQIQLSGTATVGGLGTTTDSLQFVNDPVDFVSAANSSQSAGSVAGSGIWYTNLNNIAANLYVNKGATVCTCIGVCTCAAGSAGSVPSDPCAGGGWSVCSITSANGDLVCPIEPPLSSGVSNTVNFCAQDEVGNVASFTAHLWNDNTATSTGPTAILAAGSISIGTNTETGNGTLNWPMGGFLSPAGATNLTAECSEVIPGTASTQGISSCSWQIDPAAAGASGASTVVGAVATIASAPLFDDVSIIPASPLEQGGAHELVITASNYAGFTAAPYYETVYIDSTLGLPGLGRLDQNDEFAADESTSSNSVGMPNMPAAVGLDYPSYTALDISGASENNSIGYLYVSDTQNNRVLVFPYNVNTLTLASHKALYVYGQPNFTINKQTSGPPIPTQFAYMNQPKGLAVGTLNAGYYVNETHPAPKKLWVSDSGNNRVLQFDVSSGPGTVLVPEIIFGQKDQLTQVIGCPDANNPTSGGSHYGWPSQTCAGVVASSAAAGFYKPEGLAFYTASFSTPTGASSVADYLLVSDSGNDRVVVFNLDSTAADNSYSSNYCTDSPNPCSAASQGTASAYKGLAADGLSGRLDQGLPIPYTGYLGGVGGATSTTMSAPKGVSVDTTKYQTGVYVADSGNNRVLVFPYTAVTNGGSGTAATMVIGQDPALDGNSSCTSAMAGCFTTVGSDLTGTTFFPNNVSGIDLIMDLGQNLYLVASEYDSVRNYNVVKFYKYFAPSSGPPDYFQLTAEWNTNLFASNGTQGLNLPYGISANLTTGQLFIADSQNHRIGVYAFQAPSSNASMIDEVGHSDDTGAQVSYQAVAPNGANGTNMNAPTFGVVDTTYNRIYVSDTGNRRVLVYNLDPTSGMPASQFVPFGTSGASAASAASASGAWVPPIPTIGVSTNPATLVIGVPINAQGNPLLDTLNGLVSGTGIQNFYNTAANTLYSPMGLALDGSGKLFVADSGNNRVLRFPTDATAFDSSLSADLVLGQSSFTGANTGTSSSQMNAPIGLAYNATLDTLYVADSGNDRVLAFQNVSSATSGASGGYFGGPGGSASETTMKTPTGLGFTNGAGLVEMGLFVADSGYNRIMYYDLSTSTNGLPQNATGTSAIASACYGQHTGTNTVASQCSQSSANAGAGSMQAYGLNLAANAGEPQVPTGVYVRTGNSPALFVSDTYNNRVGVYDLTSYCNSPTLTTITAGECNGTATFYGANTMYHFFGAGTVGGGGTTVTSTTTSSQSNAAYSPTGCGWVDSFNAPRACSATPTALGTPVGIFGTITTGEPNVIYIIDDAWHRVGVYETP